MRGLALTVAVGTAAAFTPGVTPMRLATPATARAADTVMMPKFLKDLFPDMEKPDDVIGNIKSFFGMKDEEPPAAEEPVAEEPAPEEPAPADDESE